MRNKHWLFTKREKTYETVKLPMLAKTIAIIDYYKHDCEKIKTLTLRHLFSNHKADSYLKEMAKG